MARHFQTLCIGLCSLLLASAAGAVSLGEARIDSRLNEPLVAHIAIANLDGMNADDLAVSIADQATYDKMGLEREYTHTRLKFAATVGKDGKGDILVTTHDNVKVPFINFVLQVRWPKGNNVKAYTILMEPPAAH
jgi:pilus assembly protein FimV